jgi:hypothetical protein
MHDEEVPGEASLRDLIQAMGTLTDDYKLATVIVRKRLPDDQLLTLSVDGPLVTIRDERGTMVSVPRP